MTELKSLINSAQFSQKEILEIVDVDVAKFQYWLKKKLIIPKIIRYGRGKEHIFGKKEIFVVSFINMLDRAGFGLEMIESFLNANKVMINIKAQEFEKKLLFEHLAKSPALLETVIILYKTENLAGWMLAWEKNWVLTDIKNRVMNEEKGQKKEPPILTIFWLYSELGKIEKRMIQNIYDQVKGKFIAAKKKGIPRDWMSPAMDLLMLELKKILES
jgi:DNA-binding transcriptional MerR regulator